VTTIRVESTSEEEMTCYEELGLRPAEKLKVLVAEDEAPVRAVLGHILSARPDCEVRFASDGAAALDTIARYRPDLLITDLAMPRMGGAELAERALGLDPDMTVVVETGNVSLPGAIDLLRRGVSDLVTKPFAIDDLTDCLHRAVETSRDRRKRRSTRAAITSLLSALEAKDPNLRGHAERVAVYARELGRDAGLDPQSCERLMWAALVHDVGKIGVPESILHKPGPLNEEEFREIKRHPERSAEIIRPLFRRASDEQIVLAVYHHHERIDGSGYPSGLAGEAIPLLARVLAVCDVWDALRSDRVYRPRLPFEDARGMLELGRGGQLEADLVDLFLARVGAYEDHVRYRRVEKS